MPFPLKVPPLELKSSSLGTKKFQEGNCFWNSYVLLSQHDTKRFQVRSSAFAKGGQYELQLSCLRLALYPLQVTSGAVVARHIVQFVRRAGGSDRTPREHYDAVRIAYRAHTMGND